MQEVKAMASLCLASLISATHTVSFKRKKGGADNPIDLDLEYASDIDFGSSGIFSSKKRLKTSWVSDMTTPTLRSTPSFAPLSSSSALSVPSCFPTFGSDSDSDADIDLSVKDDTPRRDNADLNRLLRMLDKISRVKHTNAQGQALQTKRDLLENLEELCKDHEKSYKAKIDEYETKLQAYNDIKARGNPSHGILRAKRADLRMVRVCLELEEENVGYVHEAHRFSKELVSAMSILKDIWTQVWDVYDSINDPGSSSSAAKAVTLWRDHGQGKQLQAASKATHLRRAQAEFTIERTLEYLKDVCVGGS